MLSTDEPQTKWAIPVWFKTLEAAMVPGGHEIILV